MERDQVLNHFLFYVSPNQYETVVSFYLAALAALDFKKTMDFGKVCGIGVEGKQAEFWIGKKPLGVTPIRRTASDKPSCGLPKIETFADVMPDVF